ncbi:MAG TPA: hypothetical protein VMA53_08075 [Stellaceae bacterium]|nr:hypothetical protein [Stellaceae bacterium]
MRAMRALSVALSFSAAIVMVGAEPARTQASEEATVKIFVIWQGEGRTLQTGPHEATFVGSLSGPVYVDTENGLIRSGLMTCPAILELGLDDGKERGRGRCTITAQDGAQIYADIECTGVYMIGCDGDLKLTGGTKKFEGISGGGKVTIRPDSRQITPVPNGAAKEEGTGSLEAGELHYKLP